MILWDCFVADDGPGRVPRFTAEIPTQCWRWEASSCVMPLRRSQEATIATGHRFTVLPENHDPLSSSYHDRRHQLRLIHLPIPAALP